MQIDAPCVMFAQAPFGIAQGPLVLAQAPFGIEQARKELNDKYAHLNPWELHPEDFKEELMEMTGREYVPRPFDGDAWSPERRSGAILKAKSVRPLCIKVYVGCDDAYMRYTSMAPVRYCPAVPKPWSKEVEEEAQRMACFMLAVRGEILDITYEELKELIVEW